MVGCRLHFRMISLLRLMLANDCFTVQIKTEALRSHIFLYMRCVFGYFKPNTRYYGSSDYLLIIFLVLPFRCKPSPIITIYQSKLTYCQAIHLYQYGCLNAALRTPSAP